MRKNLILVIVFVGVIFSIGAGMIIPKSIAETTEPSPVAKKVASPKYYYDSETGIYKVKAGGGGGRIVVMNYYPQNLEIFVGDTVKFYNPTTVLEPHTVTFLSDNSYAPMLESAFSLTDSEAIQTLPNDLNSEPLLIPMGENKTGVIGVNARGFFPYVIDDDGIAVNLGPNANYVFDGSEKYVNSGWIVPKEFVDEIPGSSETFTVTFENSGTFSYYCILHPWMAGQVKVTESS